MAQDLAEFPLLWAQPDDFILHPDGIVIDAQNKLALNSQLSTLNYQILPWGWSPLLVCQLRDWGIDESLLPSVEQMEAYRTASSRQTAVCLLEHLQRKWPEPFDKGLLVGTSSWCTTEEEVAAAVAAYGGSAVLKAPWSSSGRGVKKLSTVNPPLSTLNPQPSTLNPQLSPWIRRTLRCQGGVEVEPLYYNKVVDFAVEYWSEGGQVRDESLSLFTTTEGGVYSGNLVASEEEKVRRLSAYISPALLAETRSQLVDLLNEAFHSGLLPAWYTGPLGIDMMICQTPLSTPSPPPQLSTLNSQLSTLNSQFSTFNLHPFIELNLRMTMGWVALQLSKTLQPHETRRFRIVQEGGRYHYELNDTLE